MALEEYVYREQIDSQQDERELAMTGRAHHGRRVLSITVAVAIVAATAAFWAGTALHGGAGALPSNVTEPPATIAVKSEVLVDGVEGNGSLAMPAGLPVKPLAPELSQPGAQPIITAFHWQVGARAHDGDVLAEVAGVPIFLLSGSIPAYRDLKVGDSGKDVSELQSALQNAGYPVADPAGTFGLSTSGALAALYHAHGYTAPTTAVGHPSSTSRGGRKSAGATVQRYAMLPVWSVVYVPTLPASVASTHAAVGGTLHPGSSLLSLTAGRPVANVSVDPAIASTLRPGMAVRLTAGSGLLLRGHIARVTLASGSSPASSEASSSSETEGSSGQSGGGAGATVAVTLPASATSSVPLGTEVRALIIRARTHRKVLVVPISAVQAAADGSTYVEVERSGKVAQVPVVQGLTAAGNVAVTPQAGSALRAGEAVVIPD